MKMLVVIGPRSREREIRDAIGTHGAHAYTEVPEVLGQGQSGAHLGTQAFPGSSTLVFGVLGDAELEAVLNSLRELKGRLFPAERLHAFAIPAASVL